MAGVKARKSKIARLPLGVREELNRRMENGEPGADLVRWLNGRRETKRVMAARFDGRQITEQNLSEWRAGGYQEWLAERAALTEKRTLTAEVQELAAAGDGKVEEHLATVVAARYAGAVASWNGEVSEDFRRELRALRWLCHDVLDLRRADHNQDRLNFEKERLELAKEKLQGAS